MAILSLRVLGAGALCLGALSCVSLDAVEKGKKGELKIESIAFKDAIPRDFGRALGVTVRPENPDVAQLWFEKADGTIVLINVDSKHGRLGEKILVIPRS